MGSLNDVYLPRYNEPAFTSRRKILTEFVIESVLVLTAISVRLTVLHYMYARARWKLESYETFLHTIEKLGKICPKEILSMHFAKRPKIKKNAVVKAPLKTKKKRF
ncbi:hypothetical protein HZS_7848 [Henneguya salminicola]|nr:hypothetical protein HZS_7848 [Henneguya salminicola]